MCHTVTQFAVLAQQVDVQADAPASVCVLSGDTCWLCAARVGRSLLAYSRSRCRDLSSFHSNPADNSNPL
jgi:hypothetical protein